MSKRKTPEEYYNECKEKGYDLPIEDYKNAKTKIKHKCKQGHIYEQQPNSHLRGEGCPKCYGNKNKLSEEYYNECKEKGYDLPVEDYVNAITKIKHKCKKCGNIYEQVPRNHLQGNSCPKCKTEKISKLLSKTPKQYIQECKEKNVDLPIEDYKTKKIKIKFKCKKGHIYKQLPGSHLRGEGCPKCNGNLKKSPKQYYNECKENGYNLPIEDYVNGSTKIKHKCNNCGNIYKQTPSHHLHGQGCPVCKGSFLKTNQKYYKECKEKGLDLPNGNYINAQTKITHTCSRGHVYKQRPYSHLEGYGCPICNESHGERYIMNYLDEHNIKYESQKRFHDLKDKTYLSYDFYLPDYNTLIEYQGIQHYKEKEFFGGKKQFEKQQLHDKLKRKYAKNNGYKLLELKYTLGTQDLVNKYLDRRIKKY